MSTEEPSDFDIALVDAMKSIIEILAAKGVATHEEFALPLRHQLEDVRQRNPVGSWVFEELLRYCERRGPLHALHRTPPSGSA